LKSIIKNIASNATGLQKYRHSTKIKGTFAVGLT
jgi:hypothetical protein